MSLATAERVRYLFATSIAVPEPSYWTGIGIASSATSTTAAADFVAAYIRGDGTPAAGPHVAIAGNTGGAANGGCVDSLSLNTACLLLFKVTIVGGSGTKTITEWILTPDQFAYWKTAGLDALSEVTAVGTASNCVWGRAYLTGTNALAVDASDYVYLKSWVARAETLTFDELRLGPTADSVTPTALP